MPEIWEALEGIEYQTLRRVCVLASLCILEGSSKDKIANALDAGTDWSDLEYIQ